MNKQIFVNLPVADLHRSMDFFGKLGFEFQKDFTNDKAAAQIISKDIYVMLVSHAFYATFTDKKIADGHVTSEVQLAFNQESKEDVNAIVEKAKAAGATVKREPKDDGFMYSWGFEDPDGHQWEFFWMDPASIPADVK